MGVGHSSEQATAAHWDGKGLPPDLLAALTEAYLSGQLRYGATRIVVVGDDRVLKFARGEHGRRTNLSEKAVWDEAQSMDWRRQRLCPVLGVTADGSVLTMAKAQPLPPDSNPKDLGDWWGCRPNDQGCPAEHKREDWGTLDGRMVCVDYGLRAQSEDVQAAIAELLASFEADNANSRAFTVEATAVAGKAPTAY